MATERTEARLTTLRRLKRQLVARYNVKEIGMFGSLVRGEEGAESDVYPCSQGVAMMPDGRSMALLMDKLGEGALDEILDQARRAASDDRERRQVDRLVSAAVYWKAAARIFRLEREIDVARKKGDDERVQALIPQVYEGAEIVRARLDEIPAGWGLPGEKFWCQIPDKIRDDSRWPRQYG
jgi:predicted nucleotidyltransferase